MKAKKRLTEIQIRAAKATPGPWGTYGEEARALWESVPGQWIGSPHNTEPLARVSGYALPLHANVEFIIHAREDIPWLLDRVAALEQLMPDAAMLKMAVGILEDEGYKARTLGELVTAIQKYREEEDNGQDTAEVSTGN